MKVENVQVVTSASNEMKNAKGEGQVGGFLQIYAESIHSNNLPKQNSEGNHTKTITTLAVNDESKTDHSEVKTSDIVDLINIINHFGFYEPQQINGNEKLSRDLLVNIEHTNDKSNSNDNRILPFDVDQGENAIVANRVFPNKMNQAYGTIDKEISTILPQERTRNISGKESVIKNEIPTPQFVSQVVEDTPFDSEKEKLVTHSKNTLLTKENLQKMKDSITLLLDKKEFVGNDEIELKLDTEELNSVNIKFTMENVKDVITIRVDHEQAKQLIHEQVNQLGEQLQQNHNIVVEIVNTKEGHTPQEGRIVSANQDINVLKIPYEISSEVDTPPSEQVDSTKIKEVGNLRQQNVAQYQEKQNLSNGSSLRENNESMVFRNQENKNDTGKLAKEDVQIQNLNRDPVQQEQSTLVPKASEKQNHKLHENTLEKYQKINILEKQMNPDVTVFSERVTTDKDALIHEVVKKVQTEEISEKNSTIIEKQPLNYHVKEWITKTLNPTINVVETVLPEENIQRLSETMIKQIETTTLGDANVMKVKLYPEELGNVEVMLKMEDGKLVAKILVDNEQVKQLFANKMNELSDNLLKQNISIDKLQIDVNSNSSFAGNSNGNKGGYFKRSNRRSYFNHESTESIQAKVENERPNAVSVLA